GGRCPHNSRELFVIELRDLAPTFNDRGIVCKALQEDGRLQCVKPAVVTQRKAVLSIGDAGMTKHIQSVRHLVIVTKHDSGVTEAAQNLHRVEANACDIAERAAWLVPDGSAERLSAILDH